MTYEAYKYLCRYILYKYPLRPSPLMQSFVACEDNIAWRLAIEESTIKFQVTQRYDKLV